MFPLPVLQPRWFHLESCARQKSRAIRHNYLSSYALFELLPVSDLSNPRASGKMSASFLLKFPFCQSFCKDSESRAQSKQACSICFAFSEGRLRLSMVKARFASAFGLHCLCRDQAIFDAEQSTIAKVERRANELARFALLSAKAGCASAWSKLALPLRSACTAFAETKLSSMRSNQR